MPANYYIFAPSAAMHRDNKLLENQENFQTKTNKLKHSWDYRFLIREAVRVSDLQLTIIEAHTGLDFIKKSPVNPENTIVLLDMNMPQMDGIETIKAGTAQGKLHTTPVFMISTSDNKKLRSNALKNGIKRFYSKPDSFNGYLRMMKDICRYFDHV
ncbi:response regulator [Dyadobacter sp. CY327]|uniref:response regulator n=1 Tax=Dyadobacter sp. CY327 TaxID=2907301 RepID=UPI001F27ED46|nr:response regulator [Dyadobacter sp. CY327]MCE7069090.1 response regulator [Dyadobacter sp. CY327]